MRLGLFFKDSENGHVLRNRPRDEWTCVVLSRKSKSDTTCIKAYTSVKQKISSNINLYKTMISLNMFQFKKLDTLDYV